MPKSEEDKLPSLDEFGARLDKVRKTETIEDKLRANERSELGRGLRLASELLAAFLVAGALGYGADKLFDTSPWFLLVGLAIGFAAGMLNAMRSLNEMDADLAKAQAETQESNDKNESRLG